MIPGTLLTALLKTFADSLCCDHQAPINSSTGRPSDSSDLSPSNTGPVTPGSPGSCGRSALGPASQEHSPGIMPGLTQTTVVPMQPGSAQPSAGQGGQASQPLSGPSMGQSSPAAPALHGAQRFFPLHLDCDDAEMSDIEMTGMLSSTTPLPSQPDPSSPSWPWSSWELPNAPVPPSSSAPPPSQLHLSRPSWPRAAWELPDPPMPSSSSAPLSNPLLDQQSPIPIHISIKTASSEAVKEVMNVLISYHGELSFEVRKDV